MEGLKDIMTENDVASTTSFEDTKGQGSELSTVIKFSKTDNGEQSNLGGLRGTSNCGASDCGCGGWGDV